jgi:hypothetical protein
MGRSSIRLVASTRRSELRELITHAPPEIFALGRGTQ